MYMLHEDGRQSDNTLVITILTTRKGRCVLNIVNCYLQSAWVGVRVRLFVCFIVCLSVCLSLLSLCLFVRSSYKRLIPNCSNFVQAMTLGYPRSGTVLGFKGQRSTAIRRGFELYECLLAVVVVAGYSHGLYIQSWRTRGLDG